MYATWQYNAVGTLAVNAVFNHHHHHYDRGHHNIPNVYTFRVCYPSLSFIPHAEPGQKDTWPGTEQHEVARVSLENLPAAVSAEEVQPCFKVLADCVNKSNVATVSMVRDGASREHASTLETISNGLRDVEIATLKAVTGLQEAMA